MACYEAVVVPSRVLETGPLVVYEAFAAGIPVIGSRRGGIAELVRDSVDGLLVEPDSVSAWRAAIEHLLNHSDILPRLRASVRPPRTMHEVAEEMASVYASVLSSERSKARRDLLAVEEVS
jgi:glycosyltransferase involved in cell wall biosynthesis